MNAPPLEWIVDTGPLPHAPADFSFDANPTELAALKRYTGIEEVTGFRAQVKISPLAGGRYHASGTLQVSIVQASVVNLEAVPSSIQESFSVEYWPAETIGDAPADAPFEADPPEALAGGLIRVGALLSELFALALDPYPRNPGDKLDWASPQDEQEPGPFAELARLKTEAPPVEK